MKSQTKEEMIAEAGKEIFKAKLLKQFLEGNKEKVLKIMNDYPQYVASFARTNPYSKKWGWRPHTVEWYVIAKTNI